MFVLSFSLSLSWRSNASCSYGRCFSVCECGKEQLCRKLCVGVVRHPFVPLIYSFCLSFSQYSPYSPFPSRDSVWVIYVMWCGYLCTFEASYLTPTISSKPYIIFHTLFVQSETDVDELMKCEGDRKNMRSYFATCERKEGRKVHQIRVEMEEGEIYW